MRNIYFTICVFTFLAIDIISKVIVEKGLTGVIEIIPRFLSFEKVYNSGIAFSISVPLLVLKVMTIILIFGIISYYFYERKGIRFSLYDLGFSLIIGGAIGNAAGRIFSGQVIDFISVSYFAVFNIADSFICIGAIILAWWYWKNNKLCHCEGTIVTEESSQ